MPEAINPIDQYLTLLDQTKKQFDAILPGLEQNVNSILGTGPSSVLLNRAIPLRQNAEKSTGDNAGLATFSPQRTNPQIDGTQGFVRDMLASTISSGGIPTVGSAVDRVRQVGFGAGPNKLNFDRYYNHDQFKNLGWNPYIDNEAIYNANSTWLDDMSRAKSQWMSLAGLGFQQTLGNWDDLFTLNTQGDTKYAREMNRMMSIANSSRGGLGGFATNTFANSAYTFGVMGNIVLEEAALWAATALTGGVLSEIAATRTGSNLAKLFKVDKTLENAQDVIQAGKTVADQGQDLNSLSTAVNSVSDVDNARKFWKGLANMINPISQTTETWKNIKTGAKGFDAMSDWARYSKTFGSFFRDVQMMNTALAESRLEAGMVQNDVFLELYNKYVDENGKAPEGEDANKIMQQAKTAGMRTTLANAPAILLSNKVVFDKALKGFRPFRETADGSLGQMVVNYGKKAKKRFEGFVDPADAKQWFTVRNGKRIINGFRPQNLAKNGLRYMSANLAEGLQESYQETIAGAMTNYYLDTFASPERAGTAYFMEKLGEGVSDQFTAQGAETFLSGFLMGGLVQVPQTILFETMPQAGKDIYQRVKDKEAYTKAQTERKQQQDRVTNYLNQIQADPKKFYDKIYENAQNQKDFSTLIDAAEEDGDKKVHKDLVNDSIYGQVKNLLDLGYIDLFTDQIETFQKMDDKELLEAFGYDQNSGNSDEYNKDMRSRLTSVLGKVNNIKANHEKYSTIRNPFNPKSSDFSEIEDYFGFEHARNMAIYNDYTYQQAVKRLSSIFNEASGTKIGDAQAFQLSSLFLQDTKDLEGRDRLELEIKTLEEEAKNYAQGNAEQKKIGKQKETLAALLRNYKEDFKNYRIQYSAAKKAMVNEAVREEVKADTAASMTVQEGNTVEYTFKNGQTITGKVVKKTSGKVTIQYKDQNGKVVNKAVSIKAKKLKVTGGTQGQLPLDFEGNEINAGIEAYRNELEKRTRAYLSAISGLPENSPQMNKLVIQVIDYAELTEDSYDSMAAVTFLNDPYNFSSSAKAFSKAAKDAREIAKTKMMESLENYKNRMGANEVTKQLFLKFGVFFSPEEIEALVKGDKVPAQFYKQDVKTNEFEEVSPTSKLYKDIIDFLEEFETAEGFTLKGKIIAEAAAAGQMTIKDIIDADKAPSLQQILTGLGLQPGQDTYTIPIADVLKYILKNRIGSVSSRKLIQNILTTVDPSKNMVISLKSPTGFSYSKDMGITIDPRFATKDYSIEQDGKFITSTLTYLIIHPLTQMIVTENITDPSFAKALEEVMNATKAYFDANPERMQQYGSVITEMLSSPEAFVAEAFARPLGQTILAEVPYKNTNTNLWDNFMKALVSLFKKLIGGKLSLDNTALSEVVGIVSNKLAGKGVQTKEEATVEATPRAGKPAVTRTTPLATLKAEYPDLLGLLLGQYSISTGKPGAANAEFVKWLSSNDPKIDALIADYNTKNGLVAGPVEEAAPVPAAEPAPQPEAVEQPEAEVTEEEKPIPNVLTIREEIAQATPEELDDLSGVTGGELAAENLSIEEFTKLIENKRRELSSKGITFESLGINAYIIMKDKTKYTANGGASVIAKDEENRTVTIRNANIDREDTVLTESELADQIEQIGLSKSDTPVLSEQSTVEFTSEEEGVSNESVNTALDINDTTLTEEDAIKAQELGEDESKNNLLNNLGCK
jgi:hypothetical protein